MKDIVAPAAKLANKMVKLAEYDKHSTERIVCRLGPGKQLPVGGLCNWVSRQLAESWRSMQLPGWTSSLWLEKEALRESDRALRAIWQTNSGLRRAYEQYVDWSTISDVVADD